MVQKRRRKTFAGKVSFCCRVLTCAAPMITLGKEGMNLVLGAWGCGAFGNDAHVISNLFYKALKEMEFNGMHEEN